MVDRLPAPTQSIVRTDACLTFLSKNVSQVFLDEGIQFLRQKNPIWLVWPESISNHLLPPEGYHLIQRYEFFDYDPDSPILTGLISSLPSEYMLRPINRELIERCKWKSDMEFFCGNIDNFLVNDMGLCMMMDEEIISEAYISSFGDLYCEIGAVTQEIIVVMDMLLLPVLISFRLKKNVASTLNGAVMRIICPRYVSLKNMVSANIIPTRFLNIILEIL